MKYPGRPKKLAWPFQTPGAICTPATRESIPRENFRVTTSENQDGTEPNTSENMGDNAIQAPTLGTESARQADTATQGPEV